MGNIISDFSAITYWPITQDPDQRGQALLLEKGQLQVLREPFVGLVKLGGGGWRRVRVRAYYEREEGKGHGNGEPETL